MRDNVKWVSRASALPHFHECNEFMTFISAVEYAPLHTSLRYNHRSPSFQLVRLAVTTVRVHLPDQCIAWVTPSFLLPILCVFVSALPRQPPVDQRAQPTRSLIDVTCLSSVEHAMVLHPPCTARTFRSALQVRHRSFRLSGTAPVMQHLTSHVVMLLDWAEDASSTENTLCCLSYSENHTN